MTKKSKRLNEDRLRQSSDSDFCMRSDFYDKYLTTTKKAIESIDKILTKKIESGRESFRRRAFL